MFRRPFFLALLAVATVAATAVQAQFQPPRIRYVINPPNTGRDAQTAQRMFYIDRGSAAMIDKGDTLTVFREKRPAPNLPPMRIFLGSMIITQAEPNSAVGRFEEAPESIGHPMIRYKSPMIGDLAMPRLSIDSSVLFQPGSGNLAATAQQELQRVATFIQTFTPSKVIIQGHTDSDGDAAANRALSQLRADNVRNLLIAAPFNVPAATIEAQGFGEEQPIAPNDTPENKLLNRRIEVQVWE